MPGPVRRRRVALQRSLVTIQVFLLVASLFAPVHVSAADPASDPAASPTPTADPATPTPDPTAASTPDPTPDATPDPTTAPTPDPAVAPSPDPTVAPTPDPTAAPTPDPTVEPTAAPTADAPAGPSFEPPPDATPAPTSEPSADPSADPMPDPAVAPTPAPSPIAGRPYIVTFAAGTSASEQAASIAAAGARTDDTIAVLRMQAVTASDAAVVALSSDPNVSSIELDRSRAAEATPNDTSYADQWALAKIGWDLVYDTPIGGSAIVAVLDTGVDGSQPELAGKLVAGTSLLGTSAVVDPNGHGTAMAGIIAAGTDNSSGIAGVGYDGVKVMPITVLGPDGLGRDSDVIEGLVWAADHGADVALMAFSASGYSSALQAAVDYAWSKGVVLVAATGNDGSSSRRSPLATAASSASPTQTRTMG